MRTRYTLASMFWVLGLLGPIASAEPQQQAVLQSLSAYTRIQVPVSGATSFRLVGGKGDEARLVIDRAKASQFSALAGLSDKRISGISVNPTGLDKVELTIKFHEPGIQSFAYLQGQPPTLVVDLWKPEIAPAKNIAKVEAPVKPKKKPVKVAKKAVQRKIASVERARVSPLDREKDLFNRFVLPMPELRVERESWGIPARFDIENHWKFAKGDRKQPDGRAFDLARNLFSEGKFGLTIKAIEIAQRDFPESEHSDEFRLLGAFAYKRLGESSKEEALQKKADEMLKELAARRVDGRPLPFHRLIRSYFGQKAIAKQDWLEALNHLEYVTETTPKSDPDFAFLQLALADIYVKVGQPRRAERIFRYLTEAFATHAAAKEAQYRIADLLAVERNYGRVVEEGRKALSRYPEYEKIRSEVVFNIGEAYFWLGQYQNADRFFRRFADIGSAQTNAALAWVRLGEISEIVRGNTSEARGHYLKAKNGYPFSPGDLVASLRLGRIDLHDEKDPEFVAKNLSEALAEKNLDSDVRKIAELVFVDYLLRLGDVEKAIGIARSGMGSSEGLAYEAYKKALTNSLHAKLLQLNKAGKFTEAVALYDKEKEWLESYGPDAYKSAAESYRGLGLYATSNDLMERFARGKSMGSGRALASNEAGRDLLIAKAKNSFARGAYAETLANLPDEDRGDILFMKAISEQKLGRKREAQKWAEKALAQSREESRYADEQIEELAEILIDRDIQERDFKRMERTVVKASELCANESERLALARADALWYQKRQSEAAAAYREWIEKYPKSKRLDRARYNLGMSLIGAGKRADAVKVLTEARDAGQSVWSESARQELELLEWETKYSSVLKTLPPSGLGIGN